MKVFYVMVMVFVAGAVLSHGRTESEGTVFNKTQSHESMNNVTVSNSKLEAYDYFYLVMQWPRSFCNSRSHQIPCYYQQVPDHFTVHGLWPQSTSRGRIDCTNRFSYGQYPLFNSRQLFSAASNLVSDLNKYWLDLTSSKDNNECFWRTEYNKHGSCTMNSQYEYFEITSRIMVQHPGILQIRGPMLIPGKFYSPFEIRRAVYSVTLQWPMLKCITVGKVFQLLEISFCIERNLNFRNPCFRVLDCGNGKILLPRP